MFKVSARTVLELGAELISSDIIAFYELVKNAIDAKSKTGADIQFRIVMRRNVFLRLRQRAVQWSESASKKAKGIKPESEFLGALIAEAQASLDLTAGDELVKQFTKILDQAQNVASFVDCLDRACRELNTITVSDTGHGMSMPDLTRNFLTIGTSSRKKDVDQAIEDGKTKTPFLGEKGIGRLSVMRLGEALRVETARAEDPTYNILEVNWRSFADLDAMLEDIDIAPTKGARKSEAGWSGTRIIIGDLTEDWTEAKVRGLADDEFSKLIDPSSDPKKRARIAIHWNGDRISIPWMDQILLDSAHAYVRGDYTIKDGMPHLTLKMDAINLGFEHPKTSEVLEFASADLESLLIGPDQALPPAVLSTVGPFSFEAYWYNRQRLSGIEGIGNLKAVRDLLKKWSGIRLYRDDFRVFPYGEEEDDWLELDHRALGRTGFVLNKAQFIGRAMISRTRNPMLVDQTNREGLRATPEQGVFIGIIQDAIRDRLWTFFRRMDREFKKEPLDLAEAKEKIVSLQTRARTAFAAVRKIVPKEHASVVEDLQYALDEFQDLSLRAQKRMKEMEEDSKQMVQMAGVGLMVEVVAHELARASESALKALEALRGKYLPSDVKANLETLRAEMKSVSKRLRVLDELSVSGRQRAEVFDLGELVEDIKEGHAAQFRRHGITMDISKAKGSLRVKVVKGMVVQILENLLSNSVYWMEMRRARGDQYAPTITVTIETGPPTIRFTDNGLGVAPDHRDKIFRAFWSLKEKNKRRGLGLFIAQENAVYLGGGLSLSDQPDAATGRLHEFVLELPTTAAVP